MDDQRDTIIPRHYRVAGYKNCFLPFHPLLDKVLFGAQESKKEVTNVISLVKMAETQQVYQVPLTYSEILNNCFKS